MDPNLVVGIIGVLVALIFGVGGLYYARTQVNLARKSSQKSIQTTDASLSTNDVQETNLDSSSAPVTLSAILTTPRALVVKLDDVYGALTMATLYQSELTRDKVVDFLYKEFYEPTNFGLTADDQFNLDTSLFYDSCIFRGKSVFSLLVDLGFLTRDDGRVYYVDKDIRAKYEKQISDPEENISRLGKFVDWIISEIDQWTELPSRLHQERDKEERDDDRELRLNALSAFDMSIKFARSRDRAEHVDFGGRVLRLADGLILGRVGFQEPSFSGMLLLYEHWDQADQILPKTIEIADDLDPVSAGYFCLVLAQRMVLLGDTEQAKNLEEKAEVYFRRYGYENYLEELKGTVRSKFLVQSSEASNVIDTDT